MLAALTFLHESAVLFYLSHFRTSSDYDYRIHIFGLLRLFIIFMGGRRWAVGGAGGVA